MLALCKTVSLEGGGVVVQDCEPRDARPGEIRLKVAAAGICGTDMQIFNWAPYLGHVAAFYGACLSNRFWFLKDK